jgi:tetratricopeptide (TPR) repeat protein
MRISYLEHDLETGEALAADASAALDRLGSAPLLEADFYLHYGSLALARGDMETAGEYHRRALEIREAELGADHPEVAISMNNIANALTGQGQHREAEQMARRALAVFEAKLGAHPYTAASHNNIGNSLLERGRHLAWDDPAAARPLFEEAEEQYERAVAIREANLGEDHPSVAINLHNLGEVQRLQGEYEDARITLERSLAMKRKHYGDDHPRVALTETALANVLLELDEAEKARELLELAVAVYRKGESSPNDVAEALFALARAEQATIADPSPEQREEIRGLAREARAKYEEAGDDYRGEREAVEAWLARAGSD